ncbi:unnamed protein product [Phaeothamnion confervicola]
MKQSLQEMAGSIDEAIAANREEAAALAAHVAKSALPGSAKDQGVGAAANFVMPCYLYQKTGKLFESKRVKEAELGGSKARKWGKATARLLLAEVAKERKRATAAATSAAAAAAGVRNVALPPAQPVSDEALDWDAVSRGMEQRLVRSIGARECRLRYVNYYAPGISHTRWTKEEEEKLLELVKKHKEVDWVAIAAELPGRPAIQCLKHYQQAVNMDHVSSKWTKDEDTVLTKACLEMGDHKDWAQATKLLPGHSGHQCRNRWYRTLNPELKTATAAVVVKSRGGLWTREEEMRLPLAVRACAPVNSAACTSSIGIVGDGSRRRYKSAGAGDGGGASRDGGGGNRGGEEDGDDSNDGGDGGGGGGGGSGGGMGGGVGCTGSRKRRRAAGQAADEGLFIQIATFVPGRDEHQCRGKWTEVLDPRVRREPWTDEEEAVLDAAVAEIGMGNWAEVAERVPQRTPRMCKVSWRGRHKAEYEAHLKKVKDAKTSRQPATGRRRPEECRPAAGGERFEPADDGGVEEQDEVEEEESAAPAQRTKQKRTIK